MILEVLQMTSNNTCDASRTHPEKDDTHQRENCDPPASSQAGVPDWADWELSRQLSLLRARGEGQEIEKLSQNH